MIKVRIFFMAVFIALLIVLAHTCVNAQASVLVKYSPFTYLAGVGFTQKDSIGLSLPLFKIKPLVLPKKKYPRRTFKNSV